MEIKASDVKALRDATRAFLHSIMPAPVRVRSSMTTLALICIMISSCPGYIVY